MKKATFLDKFRESRILLTEKSNETALEVKTEGKSLLT
jgi:hypothetical protein